MAKIRQQVNFGRAISAIKERLKLNQTELAGLLGCRQNTISQYESGVIHPSPEVVVAASNLADRTERLLIAAYLSELYSGAHKTDEDILNNVLGNSARSLFLHRVAEIAKRRKIPEVITDFLGLYLAHGDTPGAEEAFLDAIELATWKLNKLYIAAQHAALDIQEKQLSAREAELSTQKAQLSKRDEGTERRAVAALAAMQGNQTAEEKIAAIRDIYKDAANEPK